MKIEELSAGDRVCSTGEQGTGYFLVLKVNRVTVDVKCENGVEMRVYPHIFDRKVAYPIPAFDGREQ